MSPFRRIRTLFRRRCFETELAEESHTHLEMQTEATERAVEKVDPLVVLRVK